MHSLTGRTGIAIAAAIAAMTFACGSDGGGGGGGTPTPTPGIAACTLGNGVQEATCGAGAWAADTHYLPNELVTYAAVTYKSLKDHTSQKGHEPPNAPILWSAQGAQVAPQLTAAVDAAIDKLVQDKPGLFDKTQQLNPGLNDYLIVDTKGYFAGVVANLQAAGYCAEADLFNDHRIKVKNAAAFSEDYLISTFDLGDGTFIQKNPAAYDRACQPAAFPLARNPDVPPPDQGCFEPYPPQISQFGIKVQLSGAGTKTLDSTPQITSNAPYCASIGYTDGRNFCPLRPEGTAQRVPCEGWRVGLARDTGRLGPTWQRDSKSCTGSDSGCANEPHNQYRLIVFFDNGNTHTYTACSDLNHCGSFDLAF
jgi:hypothetical protein